MSFISSILKAIFSVLSGLYEIFIFLIDLVTMIPEVFQALPIQIVSIITGVFILIIVVIFYKVVKS